MKDFDGEFILSIFDKDDALKIVMMYIALAKFSNDERYAFTADSIIRALWKHEGDIIK